MSEFTTCDASEDGACYFSADIAKLTAERDAARRMADARHEELKPLLGIRAQFAELRAAAERYSNTALEIDREYLRAVLAKTKP